MRGTATRPTAVLAGIVAFAAAASAATGGYTIRSGDTLSGIAGRHGVSVSALAEANGITDPNRIFAGRTLTIPGGAPATTGQSPAPASGPTGGEHVVQRGETLSGIARRYGVTLQAVPDANRLSDIHLIRIGTLLLIPASDLTTLPASSPSPTVRSSLPARVQGSPERMALIPLFEQWAAAYGTPADLLMAMTWLESGWQNSVVSSVGARGIGQLMPATVEFVNDVLLRTDLDPSVTEHNIRMSSRYLRWLLDRTDGDVATALAGYYQGLASVRARGVFASTAVYVADVLALRDRHFAS